MEIGAIEDEDSNVSLLQGCRTLRQQLLQEGRKLEEDEPSAQGSASRKETFKRLYSDEAGSAGPPAKQYGKKPWENKLTFKCFVKEQADAVTDDEEEEALAPEGEDKVDAHQESQC